MKNQLIIFSKNRACQLHLLLESIEKNSNNLFSNISEIYKFTNKNYHEGYKKICRYFSNVNFIVETNFYEDTINAIKSEYDFTTFMVDDNVFYKGLSVDKGKIHSMFMDNITTINCFSLRLGLNCNYSHPANLSYELNKHEVVGDFIKINVYEQKGDFAYPLSVDGHIFESVFIKSSLERLGNFTNPNTLEGGLQFLNMEINNYMLLLKESVLVGVPANVVNDTHPNRRGLEFYFSESELNIRYINNEVIDIGSMDFTNINGPHKEIDYKFKKYVTELS